MTGCGMTRSGKFYASGKCRGRAGRRPRERRRILQSDAAETGSESRPLFLAFAARGFTIKPGGADSIRVDCLSGGVPSISRSAGYRKAQFGDGSSAAPLGCGFAVFSDAFRKTKNLHRLHGSTGRLRPSITKNRPERPDQDKRI